MKAIYILCEWLLPENHVDIPKSIRIEEMKHLKHITLSIKKLCYRTKHKLYKFVWAATKAMEYAMDEKFDKFLSALRTALLFDVPWGYRILILNRLFRVRKFLMEQQLGAVILEADLDKVWDMNIPDNLLKCEEEVESGRGYTRKDARESFTKFGAVWELRMMDAENFGKSIKQ